MPFRFDVSPLKKELVRPLAVLGHVPKEVNRPCNNGDRHGRRNDEGNRDRLFPPGQLVRHPAFPSSPSEPAHAISPKPTPATAALTGNIILGAEVSRGPKVSAKHRHCDLGRTMVFTRMAKPDAAIQTGLDLSHDAADWIATPNGSR